MTHDSKGSGTVRPGLQDPAQSDGRDESIRTEPLQCSCLPESGGLVCRVATVLRQVFRQQPQ
jgi:hypothetical protein